MTKTKFFASVLCITCLWSFASNSAAQTSATETNGQHGSICVLPNSAEPPTRISPRGDYSPDTLKVRLDRRDAIRWPHRKPVLIDDMGLEGRHLIVLTSDGKRIASLRFRFAEEDEARLCLYFDGYQGVQLGNRKNALWCRAETRRCWH